MQRCSNFLIHTKRRLPLWLVTFSLMIGCALFGFVQTAQAQSIILNTATVSADQVNSSSSSAAHCLAVGSGTTLLNTATVSADQSNSNPAGDSAANCLLLGQANLLIGKSGPVNATQGTNFSYTLVVTNTGTAATSGVITVTDSLPTGLSFVSGSGFTCSASGQTVTCTSSAAIAVNGTATINLTVNPTTTSVKSNSASVIGGGDTSAASSNTVNTTVNAAPTSMVVNTIADNTTAGNGQCTLREAMTNANSNSDTTSGDCLAGSAVLTDTITFNIAGTGPFTIAPTSALPSLTGNTKIDGETQPGASCGPTRNLLIAISGTSAGAGASGLNIAAAGFTIRGLAIHSFVQHGIVLAGTADNGVIECSHIGTDLTGTSDLGNAGIGIAFSAGAANNRIGTNADGSNDSAERNIISGNGQNALSIAYSGTNGNVVAGNYIGTNVSGAVALGNTGTGIVIDVNATNNIIGTNGDGINDPAERNIISGNGGHGLSIGSGGNVIAGNYIGTDVNGTVALSNTLNGINFIAGATNNRVGTDGNGTGDAAERNLISGNGVSGIAISGAGTLSNTVAGNYIGTDVNGTAKVGNVNGITLGSGASNNTIGTDGDDNSDANERNLIAGNTGYGIYILNAATNNNVVAGNYIGTDVNGTAKLGNTATGIFINSAGSNRIGTDGNGVADAAERNLIAGNGGHGVNIDSAGAIANVVAGNYIGTEYLLNK